MIDLKTSCCLAVFGRNDRFAPEEDVAVRMSPATSLISVRFEMSG